MVVIQKIKRKPKKKKINKHTGVQDENETF